VVPKLTQPVFDRIEAILGNKPRSRAGLHDREFAGMTYRGLPTLSAALRQTPTWAQSVDPVEDLEGVGPLFLRCPSRLSVQEHGPRVGAPADSESISDPPAGPTTAGASAALERVPYISIEDPDEHVAIGIRPRRRPRRSSRSP
jgi:hypothetical protein